MLETLVKGGYMMVPLAAQHFGGSCGHRRFSLP